jgi:hypothetical protein
VCLDLELNRSPTGSRVVLFFVFRKSSKLLFGCVFRFVRADTGIVTGITKVIVTVCNAVSIHR